MNKFYITTSIAYTNAPPHIGYTLELLQADVLARYHRLLKDDVFFLTGTDEHGRKVAQASEEAGKSPKEFCDELSGKFRELAKVLNISNDDFIRTTDQKHHWPAVKEVWQKLKENGDIYKKKYRGLYCSGCEAFITKKDLKDGKCVNHQKEPEIIEEENYFFRLSKYASKIKEAIEKDKIKIISETRKNEMLSFIEQGLEDISFSRPRKDLKWGIPVPDDETQTIYVWADALTNYISALGYPDGKNFKRYWPADMHCVGKDIQKFHSLIWPGMLLSLGLSLPKTILVHGFITVAGQKMSKSLGNVVDPFELVNKCGIDAVRYFLLREIPSTEDGDFTEEKFKGRYNADLAGGIGNLVARVITMAEMSNIKYPALRGRGSPNKVGRQKSKIQIKNQKFIDKIWRDYRKALEEFKFNEALIVIWELISWCDGYIDREQPWKLLANRKSQIASRRLNEVLGNLLFAISEIAKLLQPFLPGTSEKILEQLKTLKSESLFPRLK